MKNYVNDFHSRACRSSVFPFGFSFPSQITRLSFFPLVRNNGYSISYRRRRELHRALVCDIVSLSCWLFCFSLSLTFPLLYQLLDDGRRKEETRRPWQHIVLVKHRRRLWLITALVVLRALVDVLLDFRHQIGRGGVFRWFLWLFRRLLLRWFDVGRCRRWRWCRDAERMGEVEHADWRGALLLNFRVVGEKIRKMTWQEQRIKDSRQYYIFRRKVTFTMLCCCVLSENDFLVFTFAFFHHSRLILIMCLLLILVIHWFSSLFL